MTCRTGAWPRKGGARPITYRLLLVLLAVLVRRLAVLGARLGRLVRMLRMLLLRTARLHLARGQGGAAELAVHLDAVAHVRAGQGAPAAPGDPGVGGDSDRHGRAGRGLDRAAALLDGDREGRGRDRGERPAQVEPATAVVRGRRGRRGVRARGRRAARIVRQGERRAGAGNGEREKKCFELHRSCASRRLRASLPYRQKRRRGRGKPSPRPRKTTRSSDVVT